MAKLTLSDAATFDFRGDSMSVKAALAYLANVKETDDDAPALSPAELAGWAICYAARRVHALAKDQKRFNKGAKPARIYTARVQVDGAAQNAAEQKEAARALLARALKVSSAARAPKVRKVA